MNVDELRLEASPTQTDGEPDFLPIRKFDDMSVGITDQAEIAYRRSVVHRIAAQAAVRFGMSGKFIDGCGVRQGNAEVREWPERTLDRLRYLCEDENERAHPIG
jgi:hypothetical protein